MSHAAQAKNVMLSIYGVKPYQLAFGKLPSDPMDEHNDDHLPLLNDLASIKGRFSRLINSKSTIRSLYESAKADVKIGKALKAKTRAAASSRAAGEMAHCHDDEKILWKGPSAVIGQNGKKAVIQAGGDLLLDTHDM